MSVKLKLGVLLPTRGLLISGEQPQSIETILSMAEAAEQAGLDSVWVGDSLTAKPRLEPLTTLAAVAMRTRRVRLGTAVMLAALRHPVLLAHAAATLDLISGGRTVLAVGVGGAFNEAQQQEWRSVGVEPSHRARRLEEVVEIVKGLTRGEKVSFQGRHFSLDAVSIEPRSPQPNGVPILIACHWRAGRDIQFQRAARLGDGYISISDYPEEYAKVTERVRFHAQKLDKDFTKMEAAFYMTVNLNADKHKASEEANRFLQLYYGMNIWGDRWGPYGPTALTAERISRYAEAGAGTIIVRFAAFDQRRQLEVFANEVMPALGKHTHSI
jgi:alkanesulfonate monooxygenase SsuD/methylene tetrahydromethanopterin reductase-like flavin-dependent oxidoreductase (luciferase family)